jgi:sugar/nucleoside kinase (ribokinase family)
MMIGEDVTPEFGQVEKLVEGYTLDLGGSCCLFAAQAAKLGMRVALLGKVGNDEFGRLLVRKLESSGVDTRFIVVDPALVTGLTVHLTPTGSDDRAMLTCPGSVSAVTPADVTDDLLRMARHLHYGSLFLHTGLLPAWVQILRRAKTLGLTVSLDTNWDPTGQWDSQLIRGLPYVDVLMPNDQEARLITHQPSLPDAVTYLRQRVGMLALKLGADGARLYTKTAELDFKPAPATPGGDSTGAGDSFDAGFLAGWLSDLPLQTCLEIACQCGRGVAGHVGGYAGQVWRQDVPALTTLK